MEKQEKPKQTLLQKLQEIQNSISTFVQTEPSAKMKEGKEGRNAYTFTPGFVIIEKAHEEMSKRHIMLRQQYVDISEREVINTIPFTDKQGYSRSFDKKETYVTVKINYTFIDTDSGEKDGPYLAMASACNGLDKSHSTADSNCLRYFLLRTFMWSTHEKNDEADAHDSNTLPEGIKDSKIMPQNNNPYQQYNQQNGFAQQPMMGNPATAPMEQMPKPQQPIPNGYPAQYGQQNYPTPPQTVNQNIYMQTPPQTPVPPSYNQAPAKQPMHAAPSNDEVNNTYNKAVMALAQFDQNTPSYNQTLNVWLTILKSMGMPTDDAAFVQNLTKTATGIRNGQIPN